MKSKDYNRWFIYIMGMLILAMGITLNTKTGLGVSPIISVAYSSSYVLNWNFGNTTLVLYVIYIVVELALHSIQGEKKILLLDLLQLPLTLVFTRVLNLFSWILPDVTKLAENNTVLNYTIRIIFLFVAIVLTGVGAAMSLYMRIVPNPGDGIVQALSDYFGKSVGFTKNCFDLLNICITFLIGLFTGNLFLGIGLGTVFCVIGVGRVIALFHKLCWSKLIDFAGISE